MSVKRRPDAKTLVDKNSNVRAKQKNFFERMCSEDQSYLTQVRSEFLSRSDVNAASLYRALSSEFQGLPNYRNFLIWLKGI